MKWIPSFWSIYRKKVMYKPLISSKENEHWEHPYPPPTTPQISPYPRTENWVVYPPAPITSTSEGVKKCLLFSFDQGTPKSNKVKAGLLVSLERCQRYRGRIQRITWCMASSPVSTPESTQKHLSWALGNPMLESSLTLCQTLELASAFVAI